MNLKLIYFKLNILPIHLHIYVLKKENLQLDFWYTTLEYLNYAKIANLNYT